MTEIGGVTTNAISEGKNKRRAAQVNLFAFPILGVAISIFAACVIIFWHFPLLMPPPTLLVGPKLTFLSVLLALGMFQYRYFYDEMLDMTKKLWSKDFGGGWTDFMHDFRQSMSALRQHQDRMAEAQTAVDNAQHLEAEGQSSALSLKQCESRLTELRAAEAVLRERCGNMESMFLDVTQKWAQGMDESLADYGPRLGAIFMVGFLVLISVLLDLLGIWWPGLGGRFVLVWAQSSLITGVCGFACLLAFFLFVVYEHMTIFGSAVDKNLAKGG